jgi:transposase InsO family protein
MPWREVSALDQRREFVRLALQDGVNRRELCRRFGISADVGYKWLARHMAGDADLEDRSRRPRRSPARCEAAIEALALAVRDAHPAWGARKIARCLSRQGPAPPAVSTVHAILRRHGRVDPPAGKPGQPYQRFEMEAPNLLWQMDFKGHVPLGDGASCHPLTVIDDHSRYALCLAACANEQGGTVQNAFGNRVPALWLARGDVRRQRRAVGLHARRALDAAGRLAPQAWGPVDPQPPVSPPEPRQE